MLLPNYVLRAPVLALAVLSQVVYAHPGHSNFGSADEEPSLFFLIWVGVIIAMAIYGGWRLYKILRHTKN